MPIFTGTNAADTLNGTAGDDSINGLGGADRLYGGGGADILVGELGDVVVDGGDGVDLAQLDLSAATASLRYTVGPGAQTLAGISVTNIERVSLIGGRGADVLSGGALSDTLDGGQGTDWLKGGGGDDLLIGGEGYDILDGGDGADTLIGGAATDQLTGGAGDDLLVGGSNDAPIDGGAGVDRAVLDFTDETNSLAFSVAANLTGPVLIRGTSVRNVEGVDFTAGAGSDTVSGGALADTLRGGGGDDRLTGAGGDDLLDGGLGTDTAVFSGRYADYRFNLIADGVRLTDGRSGGDGADMARGVERFVFSDRTVTLADLASAAGKRAPVALDDTASLQGVGATRVDVLANDTEPQFNGALTIASVNTTGLLGQASVVGGGVNYVTPGAAAQALAAGESLTDHFSYTVNDAFGLTATAGVTVTVLGVNDAPTATADAVTVGEDGATPIAVLANDFDVDHGDQVALASATAGVRGATKIQPDGTISYTPGSAAQSLGAGQVATDVFSYTVRDQAGLTATTQVQVLIQGVNDKPIAEGETVAAAKTGPTILSNLLANDSDVDQGDHLALGAVPTVSALGASLSVDGQGRVTYDPGDRFAGLGAGQTATDTFTYEVVDSHGAKSVATATVVVTGSPLPEPGLAASLELYEDETSDDLAAGLLQRAQAVLGGAVELVSVDASATAGTVTLSGGVLTYAADDPAQDILWGDYRDQQSFTYTVRSVATGELHTGQVTVNVLGLNDDPVAGDDALSIDAGVSTGNLWGLLQANDSDIDYGQKLTIDSVDLTGLKGRVTFDAETHSVVYHADTADLLALAPGQTLVDHFSYTLRDEDGATAVAHVSVTIDGSHLLGGAGWVFGS